MNLCPSESAVRLTNTFEHTSQFESKHSGTPHQDAAYIDELRQEALPRQRPAGHTPERSSYDRHRPAKEELELMGVEIVEDLDEVLEEEM
jgi:hypothetical protein